VLNTGRATSPGNLEDPPEAARRSTIRPVQRTPEGKGQVAPQVTVPPRAVYAAVVACRNLLAKLRRFMVPPTVALYEELTGTWRTEMIYAAARLGIADHLVSGPKPAEELARLSNASEDSLARLMRALVSIGIFQRDQQGRYALNRIAEPMRSGVPGSLRDMILYAGSRHSCGAWSRFFDVVQTGRSGYELSYGKPLFDYLNEHPEEGALFSAAMMSWSELDVPTLAQGFDYSRFEIICDVAGGEGKLLSTILARNPLLRGVLFDSPDVIARASTRLSAVGLQDRCEAIAGSFFDAVPSDCDAYILKDILHDWDDTRTLAILKACRKAARPRAKLLVMEMLINEDDDPHPAKLLDMQMMTATHEGRQRTEAEFRELFERTGFRFIRTIPLPSPTSIVVAEAV